MPARGPAGGAATRPGWRVDRFGRWAQGRGLSRCSVWPVVVAEASNSRGAWIGEGGQELDGPDDHARSQRPAVRGYGWYWKVAPLLVPPGEWTVTVTGPATPGGDVVTTMVSETAAKDAGALPKNTASV